jgi:hypothetical protein
MVLPLASVSLPMMERLMDFLKVLVMPKLLVMGWRSHSLQVLVMGWVFHLP